MNTCNFIGRLVRDPETKITPNNKKVVVFTIAVDRRDKEKTADFIPCQAWERTGELIEKYLVKGDQVGISGSLETRSYEKDGEKRTAFDILVRSIDFVGGKKEQKSEPAPTPVPPLLDESQYINNPEVDDNDSSLPFSIY